MRAGKRQIQPITRNESPPPCLHGPDFFTPSPPHAAFCLSQFSLVWAFSKGSHIFCPEDILRNTHVLKQNWLLNTSPPSDGEISARNMHQSRGESLYSVGLTYKVKWHADFLFNKFPQKISFSQWEEFQGLPR